MDTALVNHVGKPHKCLVCDAGISLLDIYPGKKVLHMCPQERGVRIFTIMLLVIAIKLENLYVYLQRKLSCDHSLP